MSDARIMSSVESEQLVASALDRVDDSQRIVLATAQLALALSALPTPPDLIQDRIAASIPTDALEPTSLLSDYERTFLPAAHVIIGLINDEANTTSARTVRTVQSASIRRGW